ncbi:matrixin family metalloprotease [Peribacillus simplex]|uniref:matrixin family metalloprotease n=1 Tax=Peribacillus simplex TaxID=1478 RepID=UPI0036DA2A24
MRRLMRNSVLLSTILVFLIPVSANAYNTFKGHKMTSGIGNHGKSTKFYCVDSSASTYSTKIANSFDRWIYSSEYAGILTPTSYKKTTTKSASTIDHYRVNSLSNLGKGVAGVTYFYVNQTKVLPQNQNWYWSKIQLAKDVLTSYPKYQQVTISHEIGHAFGLAHTNNQLMHPNVNAAYDLGIQYPRKDEYNGINYLY